VPGVTTAKIRIDGISKTYQSAGEDVRAIERIDLEVDEGEFVSIVGPSGCGKSTLLYIVDGFISAAGEVRIDGKAIDGPGIDRGVVFQEYALFPWRTAAQNVEFGLDIAGLKARERRERALHYLELVGLSAFAGRYPHELSGGMKQRVAIARSLAYDPEVLLMDEPFAALDAQTRETLQGELLRIWRTTGKTILFITHGIDEAVVLGQRVAVMTSRPGRIKHVVEIPEALRSETEDVRSLPEFGPVRHEVWNLLRDEVLKAQHLAGGAGAARASRALEEVAHV
jgi:NitT/TauT family transport system ATP-binding protein